MRSCSPDSPLNPSVVETFSVEHRFDMEIITSNKTCWCWGERNEEGIKLCRISVGRCKMSEFMLKQLGLKMWWFHDSCCWAMTCLYKSGDFVSASYKWLLLHLQFVSFLTLCLILVEYRFIFIFNCFNKHLFYA